MKKTLYILGMAVATMFASCQKDADGVNSLDVDDAVAFSAESIASLTRVNGSSWDEGDAIGITMLCNSDQSLIHDNYKYLASESGTTVSFTPDSEVVCYAEDGSAVDFIAYYPYDESWSYNGSMVLDLSAQDGTQKAQNMVDLLTSTIEYQTEGEQVFQFEHALSKVQITLSNYHELSELEDLSEISATLCTQRTHFNLLSNEVVLSDDRAEIEMVETSNDGQTAVFTAIIAPGAVSDGVIFTNGDVDYTYSATLAIDNAASGSLYSFSATVGDQGLTVVELTNDGVSDWNAQEESAISTADLEVVDGVYQIYTATGLRVFANTVNSGAKSLNGRLMNDIDLEGSENNQWTPIGTSSNNYAGTFDGGNFEISGLYINGSSEYQGLFGYTYSATICNLGVDGSVTGNNYIGGVVGYARSTLIINCYNKATVSGYNRVGGVVGYLVYTGASAINCYNLGTVAGTSGSFNVGGVIGSAFSNAVVTSCYNSAEVSASTYVGGVVGNINSATLTFCYYDSDVYSGSGIGKTDSDSDSDATGYSTADMQSTRLIYMLNNAAYTYNQTNPSIKAHAWKAVDGDYPVFDTENEATFTIPDITYYTEDDLYLICTADGMQTFADLVNGSEQSVSEAFLHSTAADISTDFSFGTAQTTINGVLMNDIELSGTWSSIVANGDDDYGYSGTFDGNGYSITGLSVSGSESGQGLFGSVAYATIKNLKVGGEVSNSASHAGIIIGKAWYSTIENCETLEGSTLTGTDGDSHAGIAGYSYQCEFTSCINRAEITGVRYVAGITGYTNDNTSYNTITDCKNYGTIIATDSYAGGIVGASNAKAILVISNCYNEGEIKTKSSTFAGGIVAKMYGTASSRYSKVTNCANIGKVSAAGQYVGGLVGACAGGAIYNSYNLGDVSGDSSEVGGLVGIHEAYDNYVAVMENCYSTASVSGTTNVGLAAGKCDGATITSCYYDNTQSGVAIGTDNNSQIVTGYSTSVMQSSAFADNLNNGAYVLINSKNIEACAWTQTSSNSYPTFDYDSEPTLSDFTLYLDGSGTESDPYQIATAAHLRLLSASCSAETSYYSEVCFEMTTDINLNNEEFTAIGTFQGTFDGDGHEVSGLYINKSASYQGLFGSISGATVKNLGVSGSVTGTSNVGSVVGYANNSSTVSNCYNAASVGGTSNVGGVVGYAKSSTVSNCYNRASVNGSGDCVGGLIGYTSQSTVTYCYNTGSVEGESDYIGGIAGYNAYTMSYCYNTGSIVGSGDYVGGIVGYNRTSSITNCIYDSSVYTGSAFGSSTSATGTDNTGSATLISTMTGGSFSTTLGTDNWKEDYSTQINDGYPILIWQ